MKILSITAQKPHSTGSGVYLTELVRGFAKEGHAQAVIAGVGADDRKEEIYTPFPGADKDQNGFPDLLSSASFPPGIPLYPVFFETSALPFPVTGMSDEMPYRSTRYCDLTPAMQEQFLCAFSACVTRAVSEFQPDLILCHHLYFLTALVRRLCPKHRIIGLCHGSDLRQLEKNPMRRAEILRAVAALDGISALQAVQREEIIRLSGCAPEKVHVLGAGYNSSVFFRTHPRHTPEPDASGFVPIRLLFAGKLSEKKGVCSLLRALSCLHASAEKMQQPFPALEPDGACPAPPLPGRLRFSLTLAGGYGNDAEYREIRSLAEASPYPVFFAGKLSQEALAAEMNKADIFVLPSFYEGLGLVLIEAIACGLSDVANDLPGIRPWMDENLPGHGICFVEPPRMLHSDEADPAALPAYEQRLSEAIYRTALALCTAQQETGEQKSADIRLHICAETRPDPKSSPRAALSAALLANSWDGICRKLLKL